MYGGHIGIAFGHATLHIDGGTIAALGWLNWPHGDGFMPAPLAGSLERLLRP